MYKGVESWTLLETWTEGGKRTFKKIRCSVCEKDPEMWGDGTFIRRSDGLLCGCYPQIKLTTDQKTVMYRRKVEANGYKFISIHTKGNTFVTGFCEDHEEEFTLRSDIVFGDSPWNGCKSCKEARRLQAIKDKYEKERAPLLEKYTELCRSRNKNITVDYEDSSGRYYQTCTVCSEDKYSVLGFPVKFYGTPKDYLRKTISCRCIKLKSEHNPLLVSEILKEDIRVVIYSLPDVESFTDSEYVDWICSCGTKNSTVVSRIKAGALGCPSCGNYGYNPENSGNFYFYTDGGMFIKYGVTNRSVECRVKEQYDSPKILHQSHYENGHIPLLIEKAIKASLGGGYLSKSSGILKSGWTETIPLSQQNIAEILSTVSKIGGDLSLLTTTS